MRSSAALLAGLLAANLGLGAPAFAESPPAARPATSADTERARRHFKSGIKLYQDGNYNGALAEFEAAYTLKPGPGSLQNIALCQKALFRYGEAADSLGRLLRLHESELSEGERAAARAAKEELESLVGFLRIGVKPEAASVTLDGAPLPAAQRLAAVRVNVGEHTLRAEAPGYASVTRSVRVAGGKEELAVELVLEPVSAFLEVRASDAGAAIAIDGKPVAVGQWVGPISSGEEHLVQVYRSGFEPFETRVKVERGQLRVVEGKLGPPRAGGEDAAPVAPGALPAPPEKPKPLGWYAQGALTFYGTNTRPFDFDLSSARSSAGGLGARVGRRLWPTLAVEGMFELGRLSVEGACDESTPDVADAGIQCGDSDEVIRDYEIGWVRFGPTLRLMTTGDRFRGVAAFGAGVLWHEFRLSASEDGEFAGAKTNGVDPYVLLELGIAANWRSLLFGLDLAAVIDGTRGLNAKNESAFEDSGRTIVLLGLGLRVGWSEWSAR